MKMKLILVAAVMLAAATGFSFGDSGIVSQIDNSTLLANQLIKVYVSVTDRFGNPVGGLERDQFTLSEGVPGKEPLPREIIDFVSGANVNEGISILFLLDNSQSMYTDFKGAATKREDQMRVTFAKQAINDLLPKIKNPSDRLGLISFNIKTDTVIPLTDDKATISKALTEIKRPGDKEGYTELYESLAYAVMSLKNTKGRKVIVLLSDGENFPYTGKDAPQFTERKGLPAAIELAQREGISVFTIGIIEGARVRDLSKIASETGGVNFQVQDLRQLKELYNQIRDRVLSEYLLTYYAGMEPAPRKNVVVKVTRPSGRVQAERSYFSATLFGDPQVPFPFLIFLMLAVGLLLLYLFSKLAFGKKQAPASLEVLAIDGKKTRMPALTIAENQREVTISGSQQADLTITGDPKLLRTEVTVKKTGSDYTIVSSGEGIKVNNQPVTTKKLRSGDLITVGNTTIVFDGGFSKTARRNMGIPRGRMGERQKIPRRSGKHRR